MPETSRTIANTPAHPTHEPPGHQEWRPVLEGRAAERALGSVPERAVFGEQLPETD
ncbi:hypothetical protein SAMN06297387_105201 [Streptomyces zhaozhouensis]|jgi:hypothetical protein|uniref:Uncharacterized protein n=1 Tax=Streptomyces zhaozhouensis TaxID=1300267 RepID=A0A286DUP6_9ACTN|nr:hypothetical protein [Streptomyces zhaozhouensis]SOD62385.1 hypothetical protein SAMN06297387_105201 [Streptomyces zhaozhouensis]